MREAKRTGWEIVPGDAYRWSICSAHYGTPGIDEAGAALGVKGGARSIREKIVVLTFLGFVKKRSCAV